MEQDGAPVEQLMTTGVFTVTPETPVVEAADTLRSEGIGSLVVVDEEEQPVGMLTTTDCAAIVSTGEIEPGATVERYMTDHLVTIGRQNSIRDAAAKMMTHGVHHLPVVDERRGVVGIISTMDLTAYLSYTAGTETE